LDILALAALLPLSLFLFLFLFLSLPPSLIAASLPLEFGRALASVDALSGQQQWVLTQAHTGPQNTQESLSSQEYALACLSLCSMVLRARCLSLTYMQFTISCLCLRPPAHPASTIPSIPLPRSTASTGPAGALLSAEARGVHASLVTEIGERLAAAERDLAAKNRSQRNFPLAHGECEKPPLGDRWSRLDVHLIWARFTTRYGPIESSWEHD